MSSSSNSPSFAKASFGFFASTDLLITVLVAMAGI